MYAVVPQPAAQAIPDPNANPRRRQAQQRLTSLWCTAAAALALSGCATTAPVDQIQYFSQAFGSVNTLGQPLLDELAVAERAQGQRQAARRARGEATVSTAACPPSEIAWQQVAGGGFIRGFCLPDAGYFSNLGDPPATAQLRGGLAVVERYAQLLTTLATNGNLEEASAQLQALGQDVSGLLSVAGVATGPLAPVLGALQPLLQAAARQANAAEARRLILEGAPKVSDLIAALGASAPAMFNTLIEASSRQAVLAEGAAVAEPVQRIDAYRLTVANYVVLLGRLQQAWDATVAAAQAPPSHARLGVLAAQAAALRADAEAARRAWAALRAGAGARAAGP